MKALVWHGERDIRYEDAPDQDPSGDEVVLDVELAGICGSDLHGYRGHPGPRLPPLVLGHEVVCTVGGERCQAEATFPMAALVRRGIRLRGQFAYSRPDFARAVEILGEGDLGLDWLSDATLEDGAEAFANLVDRPAEYAKVLLAP